MNLQNLEFRGKRVDNGEWVYGYLTPFRGLDYRVKERWYISWGIVEGYEVIPESVGMWTTSKDCEKKKIFAGDIVDNGLSGVWIVQNLENGSFDLLGIDKKYKDRTFIFSSLHDECKVIGNVTDNPEILERYK